MARHSPSSETLDGGQAIETAHLGSGMRGTLTTVGDRGSFYRENGMREVCLKVGKRGEGQTRRAEKEQNTSGEHGGKAGGVGAH